MNPIRRLAAVAVLCLVPGAVLAQSLQDPTRPPAAASGSDGMADATPRLQSVLIARQAGGRHVAVIDGDTVRLGDTWRGARVARISQREVVLVKGRERQVLTLPSPAVDSAVKPIAHLQ